jgi:membrane protease YdiL (CAAX protease family)
MPYEDLLRLVIPGLLAAGAAWTLDRMCAVRGFLPPGFREPWRRALASALVTGILWIGVFAALGNIGLSLEPDLSRLSTPQLFLLHGLLLGTVVLWFLLGYAGLRPQPAAPEALPPGPPVVEPGFLDEAASEEIPAPALVPPPAPPARVPLGRQFLAQFGFLAPSVPREIGLGVVLGIGAWVVVLGVIFAFAAALVAMGGEDVLPKQPPALIPWIAALPIAVRILISLSAGVVEETFFRGFLQPRIGVPLSTAFFVLAHFSYGQPFMLVGITLLSLIYGYLVRWRQNIWPAIAAHTLFDAVQLLVVVPSALRLIDQQGGKAVALLGLWLPGIC